MQMEELRKLQEDINQTARNKGWWDKAVNWGEQIALMHSELSEALEAYRVGNPPDDKIPEFSGMEAEFADVIIRILNVAQQENLDVIGAMVAKAEMNKTREYKHGGKIC